MNEKSVDFQLVDNREEAEAIMKREGDDIAFVACHRVIDLPFPPNAMPGTTIQECSKCKEEIWLAPTSSRGIQLLCTLCVETLIKKHKKEDKLVLLALQAPQPGSPSEKAIARVTELFKRGE